jgi:hypothetical protein
MSGTSRVGSFNTEKHNPSPPKVQGLHQAVKKSVITL